MKLICNTTDFADVVSACARLSSASKIIPVLENVKLVAQGRRADGDRLKRRDDADPAHAGAGRRGTARRCCPPRRWPTWRASCRPVN